MKVSRECLEELFQLGAGKIFFFFSKESVRSFYWISKEEAECLARVI